MVCTDGCDMVLRTAVASSSTSSTRVRSGLGHSCGVHRGGRERVRTGAKGASEPQVEKFNWAFTIRTAHL